MTNDTSTPNKPRLWSIALLAATLLTLVNTIGLCQEPLGAGDVIVLDLDLDEARNEIIASTSTAIQLWSYDRKAMLHKWDISGVVAIKRSGRRVAGVSKSGELVVINLDTKEILLNTPLWKAPITCVAWLDDENIVIGTDDGAVCKVSSTTGQIGLKYQASETVTALARAYGGTVVTGNSKGDLLVLNANDFTVARSIRHAHKTWIRQIVSSDSTAKFISAADDRYLTTWNSPQALNKITSRSFDNWLVSADYASTPGGNIFGMGKFNGSITIATSFGDYEGKPGSIVNRVLLLRQRLPEIALVVATHGSGIQFWNAKDMKFRKRKTKQ